MSDESVAAALLDEATDAGTAGTAMDCVVKAAVSVLPEAPISFVAIATDVFQSMASTNTQEALAFINGNLSLDGTGSLGGVQLFVSDYLDSGVVLAGARQAATFHELANPLRVTVANVANGGIDAGLFGYVATVVHNPGAIAKVTLD